MGFSVVELKIWYRQEFSYILGIIPYDMGKVPCMLVNHLKCLYEPFQKLIYVQALFQFFVNHKLYLDHVQLQGYDHYLGKCYHPIKNL